MNYYDGNKKSKFNVIEISERSLYPTNVTRNPPCYREMKISNNTKHQDTYLNQNRNRYLMYNTHYGLNVWHETTNRKKTFFSLCHYFNNFNSIFLTTATIFVVFTVCLIASWAIYLSSYHFYNNHDQIIGYSGLIRVSRGDIYTKTLENPQSNVYKEKSRKYKQLIEGVYKRSPLGASLKRCDINGFNNNTLIIRFSLIFNTSLIPKHWKNFEQSLENILKKDLASTTSLFRNIKIDTKKIQFRKLMNIELKALDNNFQNRNKNIDRIIQNSFRNIKNVSEETSLNNNNNNNNNRKYLTNKMKQHNFEMQVFDNNKESIEIRSDMNDQSNNNNSNNNNNNNKAIQKINNLKVQNKYFNKSGEINNVHETDEIFSYGDFEVINSTIQELLENQSTNKVPISLVTILPVKSNSDIREIKKYVSKNNNNSTGRNLGNGLLLFHLYATTLKYSENTEIVTSISSEFKYSQISNKNGKLLNEFHSKKFIKKCNQNSSFILCEDGKCLPKSSRCNQIIECFNKTDEKFCTCADYLRTQFLSRKICDGIVDCSDYSDELYCDWCSSNKYICFNAKVCIKKSKICDGHIDCPYGDDEKNCLKIAKNSESAKRENYMSKGYLMIQKRGVWGKVCIANNSEHISKFDSIKNIGKYLCKLMTYKNLKNARSVEVSTKNIQNENFFELMNFNNNNNKEKSTIESYFSLFKKSTCQNKHILEIQCSNLECGIRPKAIIKSLNISQRQYRIVGGINSVLGSWPWHAALYKDGEYQCGATLISNLWLISAGHCIYHAQNNYWVARLGISRRGTTLTSPHEQSRRLQKIVLHSNYIDSGFINDISLLKMESSIEFNDFIRPICLPKVNGDQLYNGRFCTVIGWGQLFETGRIFPDTLQEVELPIISTKECQKRTASLPLYRVTEKMFCAGYDRGGRDACLGDSGGPLMCPDENNRWKLYGITSNGYGCARVNKPGVYTKISKYLHWIHSYVLMDNITTNYNFNDSCKGHRCPLGECLSKSSICNNYIECNDQSDEKNCASN